MQRLYAWQAAGRPLARARTRNRSRPRIRNATDLAMIRADLPHQSGRYTAARTS